MTGHDQGKLLQTPAAMDSALLISGATAIGGSLLLLAGIWKTLRLRLRSALLYTSAGSLLVVAGTLGTVFRIDFISYQRLSDEREVARLSFRELAPQQFEARLQSPDFPNGLRYLLFGDAWQVDVRLLKWHGYANLLGLDARYRLERLSGRYRRVEEELDKPRSVHPLNPPHHIDFWQTVSHYQEWLPWVDAVYGSAAYAAMADGAHYRVFISQSGLIARRDRFPES